MIKFQYRILCTLPVVALVWSLQPALAQAQFTQQGPKLVGTGAIGGAMQGNSVALSGDGNTAIVGGPRDNLQAGASWVYTRSGGMWSQQAKLIGTGAIGGASQGFSVSLSGDGNTAIVGGPTDNTTQRPPFIDGAAWVYTRTGGMWSQQAKLVGTGAIGGGQTVGPGQGHSVALSGDGNTAIEGGPADQSQPPPAGIPVGAAWVFAKPVFAKPVFAGTPGEANCHGQSVSVLARQFGGLNNAAAALGFPSVQALQDAIMAFCEG